MFSGGIEIGQWLKMGQRIDLLTKIALFQAAFVMWTHHHGRKNNQQLKEMVQSIILTIINCFLWNISVFREKQISKFLVTFTVAVYYLLQMKGLWEKLFSNCRNFYRVTRGSPKKYHKLKFLQLSILLTGEIFNELLSKRMYRST